MTRLFLGVSTACLSALVSLAADTSWTQWGGGGRNFVVRAVHEANGRDPSIFKIDNFKKEDADKRFPKAWDILNDLAPSLYNKGAYTAGNTPTLQLLAQGVVAMVPAWSDQALQGISQGVLPPTTKLVQLQDLALSGQFSQAAVPSNAAHHDGALKLAADGDLRIGGVELRLLDE